MARRAQYFNEQKEKIGDRLLLVDAGGVFGTGSVQDKFKAQTALEAMNIMGYDVLNVGDRDLIYGLNFLQEQARNVRYPLISASWLDQERHEPLFKPYIIKELPGVRVAILGLSTGLMHSTSKVQGITAAPLADTVKKYLEELKPRADLIILLADVGYQGATELVRQVPGIDIIITSRDGQYIFSPGKINDTLVLEGGNQGRYLGQLKIFLDARKKIARHEGNLVVLDDKVTDNTSMRHFLDKRQQEAEKLLGPAAGTPPPPPPTRTAVPSPAAPSPAASSSSAPVPLGYVTGSVCFRCHQTMIIKWEQTLHAKAFGALKVKSQWENPDCLRCHTTGFGHPSGFLSRDKTPQFMHVQCEACHGPASQHVQNPRKGFGLVTEATCKSCHNQEQDPNFQYQAALKRGVH